MYPTYFATPPEYTLATRICKHKRQEGVNGRYALKSWDLCDLGAT